MGKRYFWVWKRMRKWRDAMSQKTFDKEEFIKEVKDAVKNLYRKTLKEASQQEIFQAVSYTVKDTIIDDWLATHHTIDREDPKIVYYMSREILTCTWKQSYQPQGIRRGKGGTGRDWSQS